MKQFRRWSRNQLRHESVLVKVLPGRHRAVHPCDPPMIGLTSLREARDAGISAVLLDARRGIFDPHDDDLRHLKDEREIERHLAEIEELRAMVFAA